MAYGFKFNVDLVVMSPTLDLGFLTERLGLTPDQEAKVGEKVTLKSGLEKVAPVSLWSTRLNEQEWLDSEEIGFSETLRECLPLLKPHRELFAKIRKREVSNWTW